jgi:hypothetical protein
MSASLEFSIFDHASADLREAIERCRPERVAEVIGQAVTIEVQDHLRKLDMERANEMGGRRTHFYAKAADQTTFAVNGNSVTVSVTSQGMRQRYEGGVIQPQEKSWLTIPARTESYGRTAGDFDNLTFIRFSATSAALVKMAPRETFDVVDDAGNVSTSSRRGRSIRDEGVVMFWLTKEVVQEADPTVLPERERLAEVALTAAKDYADSFKPGGGA